LDNIQKQKNYVFEILKKPKPFFRSLLAYLDISVLNERIWLILEVILCPYDFIKISCCLPNPL